MAEYLVREANEADVDGIREVFVAIYGEHYPYGNFYDEWWLKRSIYSDDILLLVAEETATHRVYGTASVVFDVGAHSDLVGEFGRLAVHPDARGHGLGGQLMEARIAYIENRLHLGLVENRCTHPYSQRISRDAGFAPVGFLPMKHCVGGQESISLWCRHFGQALRLRRNHPHIVPEAATLAALAMDACGLPRDAIIDEEAPAYPPQGGLTFEELDSEGLPSLLRIERGRVRNREIYGPIRLQYGFFRLTAKRATFLLAREAAGVRRGAVAGAVGFIHDDQAGVVRIFELICHSDRAIRCMLAELMRRCREEWNTRYVEVDVSAHAPRMQRTLVELGFLPAAYVPAMVFDQVERLDVIRMVQLLVPVDVGPVALTEEAQVYADLVVGALARKEVVPRIAQAISDLQLFEGLSEEQAQRVAGQCHLAERKAGDLLWAQGDAADAAWMLLSGRAEVLVGDPPVLVGHIDAGEVVGEVATLTGEAHSATVRACEPLVAAVLERADMQQLRRTRPDIALLLYRNLAVGLGRKLQRLDRLQRVSIQLRQPQAPPVRPATPGADEP